MKADSNLDGTEPELRSALMASVIEHRGELVHCFFGTELQTTGQNGKIKLNIKHG